MEFKCSNCCYTSNKKCNVEKHINNKCKTGLLLTIESSVPNNCEYCKNKFTTKSTLNRHIKTCKVKKLSMEHDLVIEKNKELERENEILKNIINKPTISTQNNTHININLAPWNNPLLPDDVEKYYREAVKKIFLAVPTLIKYIHFNEDHPENHNISIKNVRTKTAKVYNGSEWESIDEDKLIRALINDYEHTLEDYAEGNDLKYIEKIKEIKDRDSEEKVYDDLHIEVKRVIYDRNHMIKIKN